MSKVRHRLKVLAALFTMAATPSLAGTWQYQFHEDGMNDSKLQIAHLQSVDGQAWIAVWCRMVKGQPRSFLVIRTRPFLGATEPYGTRSTFHRIDDEKAQLTPWNYSNNEMEPDSRSDAEQILQALKRSTRFRVRAVTYRGETIDFDFHTTGAHEHLAKLESPCVG